MAGLALLSLVYGNFAPIWEPFPAHLSWPSVRAYGSGAILLAAGAGLFFARTALKSAMIIGVFGSVWVVARAGRILPSVSKGDHLEAAAAFGFKAVAPADRMRRNGWNLDNPKALLEAADP